MFSKWHLRQVGICIEGCILRSFYAVLILNRRWTWCDVIFEAKCKIHVSILTSGVLHHHACILDENTGKAWRATLHKYVYVFASCLFHDCMCKSYGKHLVFLWDFHVSLFWLLFQPCHVFRKSLGLGPKVWLIFTSALHKVTECGLCDKLQTQTWHLV